MAVEDGNSSDHSHQQQNSDTKGIEKKNTLCCHQGICSWCHKYFWEGQLHQDVDTDSCPDSGPLGNIGNQARKTLAFVIPAVIFHMAWWSIMTAKNLWYIFPQKYFMSLTMVPGSAIAGMTSTGGGAVAFPVMTLAFSVDPVIARDFSVMIQSCGMSAASFSILFMKVQVEYHCLLWCSLGGTAGVVFGLEVIDPLLSASQKKMTFVSIWISFAFALFLLNLNRKRHTFVILQRVRWWKVMVLILSGVIGGIFTSFSGSGIDIASFSVLTTLFRLSEKVATPTSVILMAGNSLVCFFWRGLIMDDISGDSWQFLMVCIPVVVLGAPLGSLLGTHFHRMVLATLIYVINTVALISAFVIVPQTPPLIGSSVAIIVGGFLIFLLLARLGETLLKKEEKNVDRPVKNDNIIKTVILSLSVPSNEIKLSNGITHNTSEAGKNDDTFVTSM